MSSNLVAGQKKYIVMAMNGGRMMPIGAPTTNFVDAFNYLESSARKQLGADTNNLVFYIDEDIPCPEEVTLLEEGGVKESCCGRRH
jgi:hypothetical protein